MTEPVVVAAGEMPFAQLADGRTIMARYRRIHTAQPTHSLSDPDTTVWSLALQGQEFTVAGADDGGQRWLPISGQWARGTEPLLAAVPDGECHVVTYAYFHAHHLGWLSGPVTISFDLVAMTATVAARLGFEAD